MPTHRRLVLALIGAALSVLLLGPPALATDRTKGQHALFFLKKIDITLMTSDEEAFRECGLNRDTLVQGATAPIAASRLKVAKEGAGARYRVRLIVARDAQACSGYVGSEVMLQMPVDPPFRGQTFSPYAPFADVILWRTQGLVVRPAAEFAAAVRELLEGQAGRFVRAWKNANAL